MCLMKFVSERKKSSIIFLMFVFLFLICNSEKRAIMMNVNMDNNFDIKSFFTQEVNLETI